ncbi:putative transporter [Campylobacter sp. MIT 99-7217]|nr:putative transporter [Campylobacter sp. MIT 99-7217]TQR32430.1 putative transporter [Campylobacter sp. MIT 99-7217]
MFKSFFMSAKWALWAYLGLALLLAFLYLQTSLNVAINEWYKDFYDVLQKPKIEQKLEGNAQEELNTSKNLEQIQKQEELAASKLENSNFLNKSSLIFYQYLIREFFDKSSISGQDSYSIDDFYLLVGVFLCIALPYVLIATINIYFASLYALKWREAMTFEYLKFWKNKDDNIEGSSQRIQEDIYNFSKIVESLGLAFVRALMTLIAFIPILWALSEPISKALFVNLSDESAFSFLKSIDGLLVYVALFISLGGLCISWIVGIKLPGLEYNNQKAEAAFRKELVFAEDDRKKYASEPTMIELFTGLKFNYKRLFLHYGYFNIWLILFEQMIVIVPLLIVAPSLFGGVITLGIVMQMNNAFDQVRSSFSVFITNWTKITELRSIHKRLSEFEINIAYKKSKKLKRQG